MMNSMTVFATLLVSTVLCLVTEAPCMAADAPSPTVYRIDNRWQGKQHPCADKGAVAYGEGEGDAYRWILEDAGTYQRIKNVGTGLYMVLKKDGTEVVLANVPATDTASQWTIDLGTAPWQSIKSVANGKYVNLEAQKGFIQCDSANAPTGDNWWSGQWQFVHVAGPAPEPLVKRNLVMVKSPSYGDTIKDDTTVNIQALGLKTATAKCWKQGEGFGADSTVAKIDLDAKGNGSFVFPAGAYPHGPIMVRITGTNGDTSDTCYLQLYNSGGVVWNEGVPAAAPSPAEGMSLVYADDFKGKLSISPTGAGTTYTSHKPGGGDFSGVKFVDHTPPNSPFSQVDTFLRIRADANKNATGLISALRMDGTGITATPPCYFECRMTALSAPGTWPAFWVMTRSVFKGLKEPADELDTIEAYGGEGPRNPNQAGYWIATHSWNQGKEGDAQPGVYKQIPMTTIGGKASWATTFHIYGTKITPTDTIYYCDNIEVARHPTRKLSKTEPWFFFINLAIGNNGWPADLSRYGGIADMYVDYVRVYKQ